MRFVLAATAALLVCAPAGAATHTYSFTGTLSGNPSSSVTGYLGYDDAAAIVQTQGPNITFYNALTHLSANGAGFAFVAELPANGAEGDVAVGDGTIGGMNDVIGFFANDFAQNFGAVTNVFLSVIDRTNSTWTSTALPSDILLPTLTERTLQLQVGHESRFYVLNSVIAIDAIPPGAVPEPANWAMMIAGFGLAGAAARRRRPSVGLG